MLISHLMLTNSFQLADVHRVVYAVYAAEPKDDQRVVEAEFALRARHPKVLATYYAHELWVFAIDNETLPEVDGLVCGHRGTVTPAELFRKPTSSDAHVSPQVVHLTFVRLVKKMVLSSMVALGGIVPFGNHALSLHLPHDLVMVDVHVTSDGGLYATLAQQAGLLFIAGSAAEVSECAETLAVYLIPSGIRALFASGLFALSVVPPPVRAQELLAMLSRLTGMSLGDAPFTWVRVTPNLAHLNNMTPNVAKYLASAAGGKQVAWPLELCVLQTGEVDEEVAEAPVSPLGLIDSFCDWQSAYHTVRMETIKFESVVNTPLSSMATPAGKPQDDKKDDDDLFGDASEEEAWEWEGERGVTDADFNFFDEDVKEEPLEPEPLVETVVPPEEAPATPPAPSLLSGSSPAPEPVFLDIPMEDMTVLSPYHDPGAPLPIRNSPAPRRQSQFSPLTFNPIIRTDVDSKYVTGGRFFTPRTEAQTEYSPLKPAAEAADSSSLESDSDYVSPSPPLPGPPPPPPPPPIMNTPVVDTEAFGDLPAPEDRESKRQRTEEDDKPAWLPLVLRLVNVYQIPDSFRVAAPVVRFSELNHVLPLVTASVVHSDTSPTPPCYDMVGPTVEAAFTGSFPEALRLALGLLMAGGGAQDLQLLLLSAPQYVVNRLSFKVKLASEAFSLWRHLGLAPVDGPCNIRLMAVVPDEHVADGQYFVELLVEAYESCQLGSVEKVAGGVVPWSLHAAVLAEQGRRLSGESSSSESSSSAIIVLFGSTASSPQSHLDAARGIRTLELALLPALPGRKGSTPPKVLHHMLPLSMFTLERTLVVPSTTSLSQYALGVYTRASGATPYHLAKPVPSTLTFPSSLPPVYLHVAYERSVDRNWCVCCWTDQWGGSREVKLWYCSPGLGKLGNSSYASSIKLFEDVSNDIWKETLRIAGLWGGTKYVVLTRVNNIIPEDELHQWRRLLTTSLQKDVQLVVATVGRVSRVVVEGESEDEEMGETVYDPVGSDDASSRVVDPAGEVYGAVFAHPRALASQQTRSSIRTGLLVGGEARRQVFEVNLLSCSGGVGVDELMRQLVQQYRGLLREGVVPWHVDTVGRVMREVVHLRVEQ